MIETKQLITEQELFACFNGETYLTPHFFDNVECDFFETPNLQDAALFRDATTAQSFIDGFYNLGGDNTLYFVVKIQAIVTKL